MAKKYRAEENYWISFADIMTGLMVIFLLISVSYMATIEEKYGSAGEKVEEINRTREDIKKDLEEKFSDDLDKWNAELSDDLSIKFKNPQVMYKPGKANITPYFQDILHEFIPKYLDVLLDEKYDGKISEIRVEGHTDDTRIRQGEDAYLDNLDLSQARARNIVHHIRNMHYYYELSDDDRDKLQYLLTANGMSYGRALDENGELIFSSGKNINRDKSRRVEFKVVVSTQDILNDNVIKNNKE